MAARSRYWNGRRGDMTDPRFSRLPISRFEGQRGPNGKLLCRECGTETEPPKRTFCSSPCVDAWKAKWPSDQRRAVLARDHGVCAACGIDCLALEQELARLRVLDLGLLLARVAELGLTRRMLVGGFFNSLWEMDHIVPVIEGGGDLGLSNLRTLCWKDHAIETAKLAARRAEQRRRA